MTKRFKEGLSYAWDHDELEGHLILDSDGETEIAGVFTDSVSEEEATQLGKMFAASPELYNAVAELVELKEHKDNFGKTDEYLQRQPIAWEKARAAMRKAEEG